MDFWDPKLFTRINPMIGGTFSFLHFEGLNKATFNLFRNKPKTLVKSLVAKHRARWYKDGERPSRRMHARFIHEAYLVERFRQPDWDYRTEDCEE
jgi:hypothetical protein